MWWRWGFVGVLIGFLCAPLPNASADPGLIYACVQQGSNQVRIVSGPGQCRKPETPVTWSIQGPVGPAGPQGPKGETGPAGPLGVYAPAVVDVMCQTQSINNALQTVSGNPLTIQIHGTCSENITVTRNDVMLIAMDGAVLTSPDPTLPVIHINGAQRTQINGFIVTKAGILATDGASLTMTNNTVSEAPGTGIYISGGSVADLIGNTVEKAVGIGIAVEFGSTAYVGNSKLTQNGQDGLEVYANSTVALQGTQITENAQHDSSTQGVSVQLASSLRSLGGNQITDNKGVGVYVKASALRVGDRSGSFFTSDQILRNFGGGIHAGENAMGDLRGVKISDNLGGNSNWTGFGLTVSEGSRMRLTSVQISGGIRVRYDSAVRFTDSGSTVDSMNCANNGYDTGSTGQPSIAGSAPAALVGVNSCYKF